MRVAVPLEQCWHEVPGGTARTAIDLTTALADIDGIDVVGVSARHDVLPPAPWTPTVEVFRHRLPRPALYESWHLLRRPLVESTTGPVDVVHAVGGAVPGTKAPLVVTVHDLAFLHHPEMFTRQGRRFFRRFLDLVRAEADQVQVPSQATLEDCAAAGIDPDRLRHVPWGCNVEPPEPGAVDRARERFGLREPYVVCVGTLEPRKNLRRLLDAWHVLDRDDVRLVIVGPIGWGDIGFDRHGSSSPDHVSMTGFVDDRTRDALFAGAEFSCYPSLFEGFGLPVLESMALGCPVLTARGTATEELVHDGAGLAVDAADVDALAAGIATLLDDPERRARLAATGRERAAEYTWERAARLAADGYREVLS